MRERNGLGEAAAVILPEEQKGEAEEINNVDTRFFNCSIGCQVRYLREAVRAEERHKS